jgi:hypothetical protein
MLAFCRPTRSTLQPARPRRPEARPDPRSSVLEPRAAQVLRVGGHRRQCTARQERAADLADRFGGHQTHRRALRCRTRGQRPVGRQALGCAPCPWSPRSRAGCAPSAPNSRATPRSTTRSTTCSRVGKPSLASLTMGDLPLQQCGRTCAARPRARQEIMAVRRIRARGGASWTPSFKPQNSTVSIRRRGSPTSSPASPIRRKRNSQNCCPGIGTLKPHLERRHSRGLRRRAYLQPRGSRRSSDASRRSTKTAGTRSLLKIQPTNPASSIVPTIVDGHYPRATLRALSRHVALVQAAAGGGLQISSAVRTDANRFRRRIRCYSAPASNGRHRVASRPEEQPRVPKGGRLWRFSSI